MSTLNFTVEESNMIGMYRQSGRTGTAARIGAAIPFMEEAFRDIAQRSIEKLNAMTDAEFAGTSFAPTGETDGSE